jgi:hypothetical protein
MKSKLKIGLIGLALVFCMTVFSGCESWDRFIKSIGSDVSGGMDRHITVYSQTGEVLAEYDGMIDIQDTEYGNKVLFDLDGKRTVIYNATVIAQEK